MKKIFLFAGEQSADNIGSHLVSKLTKSGFSCLGVGGEKMKKAGLEIISDIENFQVMGFIPVLKKLPKLIDQFRKIKQFILQTNPDLVIFIDYPGFSLKMAKELRKNNFAGKIIQYVCPTIWAWKKKRKQILEKYFDLIFCLFPFEVTLFKDAKVKAIWIGHLLALEDAHPAEKKELILFPGSRKSVIELNLPGQIQAAKLFQAEHPIEIAISCAKKNLLPLISNLNRENYKIYFTGEEKDYAKYAIATCGTITLELALRSVQTVVTYKVNKLEAWIAQKIFHLNLPYYCIVNLLLDRMIYPEIIHYQLDPILIASSLKANIDKCFPFEEFKNKIYNKDHDQIFLSEINSLLCL